MVCSSLVGDLLKFRTAGLWCHCLLWDVVTPSCCAVVPLWHRAGIYSASFPLLVHLRLAVLLLLCSLRGGCLLLQSGLLRVFLKKAP